MLFPDFILETDTGESLALASLRGKRVVLYFYPKDDTSGCTMESCAFRDLFPVFDTTNAVVLGISPDDAKSHRKFKAKYNLPFTLLVDEGHALAELLGLWVEKTFYGQKYMGVARTTFIIGPNGEVEYVFDKVNPSGHAEEVMAYLVGGEEAAKLARASWDAAVAVAPVAAKKPAKKSAKKSPRKAAKKPAKKAAKKPARKPARKAARKPVKKAAKKAAKRPSRKPARKPTKTAAKRVTRRKPIAKK